MKRFTLLLAVALAAVSCDQAQGPSGVGGPDEWGPTLAISDGMHEGNEHFFFLPPMVAFPEYEGAFDASLTPIVRIVEEGNEIATFTASLNAADQQYHTNWHTDEYALDPAKTYRISVEVDGIEIGYADVDVVSNGRELKDVVTGVDIPLKDGRTLPIKFRIETGVLDEYFEEIIVFESSRSQAARIWEVKPDGTGLRKITADSVTALNEAHASPNPEGTLIAFYREPAPLQYEDVVLMDFNGENRQPLGTTGGGVPLGVEWVPDGSEILFAAGTTCDLSIKGIKPDGTGERTLVSPSDIGVGRVFFPDQSISGKVVFIGGSCGSPSNAYTINHDGTDLQQIADNAYWARWSPDGTRLAVVRGSLGDGSTQGIWVMDADGGNATRLSPAGEIHYYPAWSPDGAQIVYSKVLTPSSQGRYELWIMDALSGADLARVTAVDAFPAGSADQKPVWIRRRR